MIVRLSPLLLLLGLGWANGETLQSLTRRSPSRFVRSVYQVGEGEPVAMTCSFSNSDTSLGYFSSGGAADFNGRLIIWYRVDGHGGQELITIGQAVEPRMKAFHDYKVLMADSTTSVLFIPRAAANHVGFYKCMLSDGGPIHQMFYVNLTKSHLLIRHPHENVRTVATGANVRFNCNVSYTYPTPLVYWTQGRGRAKGTVRPVAWGNILNLQRVTKEMAGIYTCHADDFLSPPVSTSFQLRMTETDAKSAPRFISVLYNHKTGRFAIPRPQYGHVYFMTCRSAGYPRIYFHWFKNGKIISELRDPNLSIQELRARNGDYVSELQIRQFKVKDRGAYQCKAYNDVGSIFYTFQLDKIRGLSKSIKGKLPSMSRVFSKFPPTDDEDFKPGVGSGSGFGEFPKPAKKAIETSGFVPPAVESSGFVPDIKRKFQRKPIVNVTRVSNFTTAKP